MDGDRVMVATASRAGTIDEIGQEIAQRLRTAGLPVDAAPADEVRSLAPYRAVILGSETHDLHWRHEALTFLHRFRRGLAERDLWLFQTRPIEPGEPEQTFPLPHRVEEWLDDVRFRGHATFAERWIGPRHVKGSAPASTGAEPTRDTRNVERIEAFADAIAKVLLETAPA